MASHFAGLWTGGNSGAASAVDSRSIRLQRDGSNLLPQKALHPTESSRAACGIDVNTAVEPSSAVVL